MLLDAGANTRVNTDEDDEDGAGDDFDIRLLDIENDD